MQPISSTGVAIQSGQGGFEKFCVVSSFEDGCVNW
jgi:hypothetical protein